MKRVVLMLSFLISSVSFGSEYISGHWCQYSPFNNEVTGRMEIDEDGDYRYYVQNIDGAVLLIASQGFISQGASSAHMEDINGVDAELVEAVVRDSEKGRQLTLVYPNLDIVYQECL